MLDVESKSAVFTGFHWYKVIWLLIKLSGVRIPDASYEEMAEKPVFMRIPAIFFVSWSMLKYPKVNVRFLLVILSIIFTCHDVGVYITFIKDSCRISLWCFNIWTFFQIGTGIIEYLSVFNWHGERLNRNNHFIYCYRAGWLFFMNNVEMPVIKPPVRLP